MENIPARIYPWFQCCKTAGTDPEQGEHTAPNTFQTHQNNEEALEFAIFHNINL